jgi:gas vesicle protein
MFYQKIFTKRKKYFILRKLFIFINYNKKIMFDIVKKIQEVKKERQVKTRNKIILFSLISGVISAVTAVFFSSEENRQKVAKAAKDAAKKAREVSEEAKVRFEEGRENFSQMAKENGEKFAGDLSNKFRRLNSKVNGKKEVEMGGKKATLEVEEK